jgi:ubiquinone/menaquinone biosynthesis C-methylase UbiE
LPAAAVETALLSLIPPDDAGSLLDIGTGTGRVLELLAPRVRQALGIDASKSMLALARARLAGPDYAHCAVRLADMYRLPLASASYDTVVLQMVLHHAEDPAVVIVEAVRVLRPDGRLLVVDLAEHKQQESIERLAHRWPGFSDDAMDRLFATAGLERSSPLTISGGLIVRIWPARRPGSKIAATASTVSLTGLADPAASRELSL